MTDEVLKDIDRAFKALEILEEAMEQGNQKEFYKNQGVQFVYNGRKFEIRELPQ